MDNILYEKCNKIIWDITTALKGVVYAKNMMEMVFPFPGVCYNIM